MVTRKVLLFFLTLPCIPLWLLLIFGLAHPGILILFVGGGIGLFGAFRFARRTDQASLQELKLARNCILTGVMAVVSGAGLVLMDPVFYKLFPSSLVFLIPLLLTFGSGLVALRDLHKDLTKPKFAGT